MAGTSIPTPTHLRTTFGTTEPRRIGHRPMGVLGVSGGPATDGPDRSSARLDGDRSTDRTRKDGKWGPADAGASRPGPTRHTEEEGSPLSENQTKAPGAMADRPASR